jgi:hypothetical protein
MRAPTAAQLLDAWERALSESPTRRALSLLAAAHPELSEGELAALPIGRRDARLLRLRECLFGSQLLLVVPCPACGEQIESQVRTGDLAFDQKGPAPESYLATSNGYRITFRLPAGGDLMALPDDAAVEQSRELLLGRCVLDARDAQDVERSLPELPEAVRADLVAQMELADPGADIELAFDCPACAHRWQDTFDIGAFLWREIHAWAHRTLRDVHSLARAYGWREGDVLALSPTRRQIYLELCRQ